MHKCYFNEVVFIHRAFYWMDESKIRFSENVKSSLQNWIFNIDWQRDQVFEDSIKYGSSRISFNILLIVLFV